MATIINTPGTTQSDSSGVGVVVGVIIAIVIIALLALYGIPALRGSSQDGVNVQIPDKVNVNLDSSAPAAGN